MPFGFAANMDDRLHALIRGSLLSVSLDDSVICLRKHSDGLSEQQEFGMRDLRGNSVSEALSVSAKLTVKSATLFPASPLRESREDGLCVTDEESGGRMESRRELLSGERAGAVMDHSIFSPQNKLPIRVVVGRRPHAALLS